MNIQAIATGTLSGIVHGFCRSAKKKYADGDIEGAMKCIDTLMANFNDPITVSSEYTNARKLKEDAIFRIECGENTENTEKAG